MSADEQSFVSIPIRAGGIVLLRDLLDLLEIADGQSSEDDVVFVMEHELQWQGGQS